MPLRIEPVVLGGTAVRLEPLSQDHAQGLYNRGRGQAGWAYMPRGCFVDLADTRQWVEEALAATGQLPFAIVETARNPATRRSCRRGTISLRRRFPVFRPAPPTWMLALGSLLVPASMSRILNCDKPRWS